MAEANRENKPSLALTQFEHMRKREVRARGDRGALILD
jgi:hypothetical protein